MAEDDKGPATEREVDASARAVWRDEGNKEEESRASIEHWAAMKGMWPLFATAGLPPALGRPATSPNPRFTEYAQAKAFARWADGQVVTEADFDKAVAEAKKHVHR